MFTYLHMPIPTHSFISLFIFKLFILLFILTIIVIVIVFTGLIIIKTCIIIIVCWCIYMIFKVLIKIQCYNNYDDD